jgi:hypothetical protein
MAVRRTPPSAKYALNIWMGITMAENQLKRLGQAENDTLMGSDARLINITFALFLYTLFVRR